MSAEKITCACGKTEIQTVAPMTVTLLRCPWCPPEKPGTSKPTLRLILGDDSE